MEPKNPLLFTTAQKLSLSRADKSNSLPFSYLLTFILYRHHVCAWVSEIVPFFEALHQNSVHISVPSHSCPCSTLQFSDRASNQIGSVYSFPKVQAVALLVIWVVRNCKIWQSFVCASKIFMPCVMKIHPVSSPLAWSVMGHTRTHWIISTGEWFFF